MLQKIELSDGAAIEIRRIRPSDRDVLQRGLERMGPESRYRRFFAPVSHLSEAQLDYLTRVDHHDHEALVAFASDTREGVGVARFVRLEDHIAEPAVVVTDRWQGRGVGTALLNALAERAREEGIRSFLAPVLAENAAAISSFSGLGETRVTTRGSEVELMIALDEVRDARVTLQRLLRHAADQTIQPSLSFWHRLTDRENATGDPGR
jgi:GNAT superfamily N-acetyltransferase